MRRLGLPATAEAASVLGLVALAGVYLLTVLPALGDDPIAGGDEGWIMSAAGKLATDGVFGSDLFRGFYGAEQHYYFNLPLDHFVLAGVFKIFGIGLVQARLVSVVSGLALLALTYGLGRRLGGAWVGLGAAALLVLLRLNLAPFSGLTLTDLGATVRYDLVAVPYGVAAMLILARRLPGAGLTTGALREPQGERRWNVGDEAPSLSAVVVAGLLCGVGGVTQFIGALFVLPLAAFLLTLALPRGRRFVLAGALCVAATVPFLPYGAYAVANWDDFRGQSRTVEQETDFLSPAYYWDAITNEPDRYRIGTGLGGLPSTPGELASKPSARLALLVLGPLAAAYVLWRGRREPMHRLVGFALLGVVIELALFESTKRFVYWVVAAPLLCVAIADLGAFLWAWRDALTLPSPKGRGFYVVLRAAVVVIALLFAVEGLVVAAKDVRDAGDHRGAYASMTNALRDALPASASAMGDNRLWPAMRDRDFRSLLLLFYDTNPRISKERTTSIEGSIERSGVDYILLSPLSREILTKLSPADGADFERFIDTQTCREGTYLGPTYGPIDVYRVLKPGGPRCELQASAP
ncbi:MAG TPA: hypothetical protein VI759_03800 [Dehalococcoidia bacterium]|nr:hypothetical protein [Dehalococcoidia bacterium]